MNTFMFPGQGSQSKGMGDDLFDEFPELISKADKILGYSIKELCLDDPKKELSKTQFTQPALYVVNALSYFKIVKEQAIQPNFLIGHSLGEFNALLAAQCFDFETGLKLVKKRGELMSQAKDGAMAAILNGSKDIIETTLNQNGLSNIDLANYNTPSQIVISGLREEIGAAQAYFQQGTMLYYPLNASGAFHSRFMQPAREEFEQYLKTFTFSSLKIPVISNVSAKPYQNDQVTENLSNQITSSVRWFESIQYLIGLAKSPDRSMDESMDFQEIGHGDVLTKLIDKIKEETTDSTEQVIQQSTVENSRTTVADTSKVSFSQGIESDTDIIIKPVETIKNLPEIEEVVRAWNKKYPVGTKVKSSIMDNDDLETRTEAIVLFGHRAAVYMKEYNGYFDLNEITPQ